MSYNLSDYNYHLPKNLIAQQPSSPRDSSRLLILNKKTNKIFHRKFHQIDQFLKPGDVIVLNNTKVIPARLFGHKITGGKVEILLLKKIKNKTCLAARPQPGCRFNCKKPKLQVTNSTWETLTKPGLKSNQTIIFTKKIFARILSRQKKTILEFNISPSKFNQFLNKHGHTPLPPYIKTPIDYRQAPRPVASNRKNSQYINNKIKRQYQTIYAKYQGSVAAPTAGLHFTKRLIKKLKKKGVQFEYITLHIGLDTFQPVRTQNIKNHKIHSEYVEISKQTANRLNLAKRQGHRIIACGTTVVRALESAAFYQQAPKLTTSNKVAYRQAPRPVASNHKTSQNRKTTQKHKQLPNYLITQLPNISQFHNNTSLFITPGYKFKIVDAIITNFHLPKSTLLMLVSAFTSLPQIKKAYLEAIKNKYRFYSFGDAMLIF